MDLPLLLRLALLAHCSLNKLYVALENDPVVEFPFRCEKFARRSANFVYMLDLAVALLETCAIEFAVLVHPSIDDAAVAAAIGDYRVSLVPDQPPSRLYDQPW